MKDYNSAGTGFELPPKEELTEKDLERWATATYNNFYFHSVFDRNMQSHKPNEIGSRIIHKQLFDK